MLEVGHLDAPETQLAQRVMKLLRAMRVVIDAGIHTGQLTPAAALELLLQRVPMDRHAALAEVRRVCASPGASSAYALGCREYLQMRSAWIAAHGAGTSLRAFHENVLSYGRIPPALASWGMGLD
jgi:uncharacterized protein (DUF885 family)